MLALALRNVLRHASHSILLAALFALAAFLFISGNSLLFESNQRLQNIFVRTVTGDAVIAPRSEESLSLFGANTPAIGELVPVPVLKQKEELADAVRELPGVDELTPLVSTAAVMDLAGRRSTVPLFGIEAESYFSVISGLELLDGRFLEPGERGVLLTASHIERIEEQSGEEVDIGEEVLFTTARGSSFHIRAVPLRGIFRYPVSMEYVEDIALADAATVRELSNLQIWNLDESTEIEGPASAEEVDSLFAGNNGNDREADSEPGTEAAGGSGGVSAESVLERVHAGNAAAGTGEAAEAGVAAADGSAHFLLLRGKASSELRELAAQFGADLLSWRQAAGQPALLAFLLLILFNSGFVLFVIAVTLGAMNIVFLSTYRRSREIGTLRAIGASDGTVRGIFVTEHIVIGILGWLTGLAASYGFAAAVAHKAIEVDNQLVAMLLGGRVIRISIEPLSVALCVGVILLVVAISVLFPLSREMRKPAAMAVREE